MSRTKTRREMSNKEFFFLMWTISLSLYQSRYSIVLCLVSFFFLATTYVGSQFPNQELNPYSPALEGDTLTTVQSGKALRRNSKVRCCVLCSRNSPSSPRTQSSVKSTVLTTTLSSGFSFWGHSSGPNPALGWIESQNFQKFSVWVTLENPESELLEIQCLGNTGKPITPSLRKSCCLCLDSNPSTGNFESHVPADTKKC